MKYPLRSTIIALAGTLMMPANAMAAESGAWDDFFTEDHADGWTVYDYFDEKFYFPSWFAGDGGDIYFTHTLDNPLYFSPTWSPTPAGVCLSAIITRRKYRRSRWMS